MSDPEPEIIDLTKDDAEVSPSAEGECDISTTGPPHVWISPIRFNRPDPETVKWLLPVWQAYGCKSSFTIVENEWQGEIGFVGLAKKLDAAEQAGLLSCSNPLPDGATSDGKPVPQVRQVTLGAAAVRTLEETVKAQETERKKPGPKTNVRQITWILPDGTKTAGDLRNMINAVLATAERAATSCMLWLDVYNDPSTQPSTKTRVRINLERATSLWGPELDKHDPPLYQRMMMSLGHPEKSCLNPNLVLEDMEEVDT